MTTRSGIVWVLAFVAIGCGGGTDLGDIPNDGVGDAAVDTARPDTRAPEASSDTRDPVPDSAVADSARSDSARDGGAADTAPTDSGSIDVGADTKPTDTATGDAAPADTPSGDTTSVDTGRIDAAFDAPPFDGPPTSATVGDLCTSDDHCDRVGDGINKCSNALFRDGALYPTPVCIGVDCDPGDGTVITGCDGEKGVCLSTGSGGICLPACSFDNTGAAPAGCRGADVCNVFGFGKDSSGAPIGVGYCFGGCTKDLDCATGVCQRETGLCVNTRVTYTKPFGSTCVTADATANRCSCLYTTASGAGYCSTFCKVGDPATTCPSGFACSAGLPTNESDGTALFSRDPAGIGGYCLKTCSTDADCAPLNAYCDSTASGKICQPGRR
jgi:hypothetical protein